MEKSAAWTDGCRPSPTPTLLALAGRSGLDSHAKQSEEAPKPRGGSGNLGRRRLKTLLLPLYIYQDV